jgi:hypothetical protein
MSRTLRDSSRNPQDPRPPPVLDYRITSSAQNAESDKCGWTGVGLALSAGPGLG